MDHIVPRMSSHVADWELSELFWTTWKLLLAGAAEGRDCIQQGEEVQDSSVHDWDTGSIHFPLELVWEHNGEARLLS